MKPKLLVIGGSAMNIPGRVHAKFDVAQIEQDVLGASCVRRRLRSGTVGVVVITRWVSHSMSTAGRRAASAVGIPCVYALTGNYIMPELERVGLTEVQIR